MTADRKKVLFLIPSMVGGGAERFFAILLKHLDRRRFEPELGLLRAEGEYMGEIPDDVVVHTLNVSRARYALPGIVRLVWRLRPRTILSTLPQMNMMVTLSRPLLPRGTRVLLQEAADPSGFVREEVRHKRVWLWFYRHCYRHADRVLCLSRAMVDDMASSFRVPREKLLSIYYPVDVERVTLAGSESGNPFSGPGPHLLAAGRLTRQKGFDVLLDAMPTMLQQLPGARLTILGHGPLQEELRHQAQGLGISNAVDFPGFQQNPWRYIQHASAFVLPSRYEGLPNVLLEALVLGTPIVASDCPGAIREVQNCGVEVILVPPEDPAALSQAIISICRAPKRSPGSQMSQSAANKFGLSRILNEYSDLL